MISSTPAIKATSSVTASCSTRFSGSAAPRCRQPAVQPAARSTCSTRTRSSWRQLIGNPALIPDALEECFRLASNGYFTFPRIAARDTEVGGTPILKGMVVRPSPLAPNYDPDVFPDPTRFDIHRKPKRILSFGAGPHHCIGNILGRTTITIAIRGLLARFPKAHLIDPRLHAGLRRGSRRITAAKPADENPLKSDLGTKHLIAECGCSVAVSEQRIVPARYWHRQHLRAAVSVVCERELSIESEGKFSTGVPSRRGNDMITFYLWHPQLSFDRPHAHAQVPSHRHPSIERVRIHLKSMVDSPGWLEGFPEVGCCRGPRRGRWAKDLLDDSATGESHSLRYSAARQRLCKNRNLAPAQSSL